MPNRFYPRNAVDQGAITQTRQKAAQIVQTLAASVNAASDLMYRDLLPRDFTQNGATDLGYLTNPAALVANTWLNNVFPDAVTKTTQAFAILGIALRNTAGSATPPRLDAVEIMVASKLVVYAPLSEIQAPAAGTTPQEGYWFEPVWVPPQTQLTINLLSGTGQTISTEQFVFIGVVGEKEGDLTNSQASPQSS